MLSVSYAGKNMHSAGKTGALFVGHCLTDRAHLQVDICISLLTTLLLVDTTDTGFSLVIVAMVVAMIVAMIVEMIAAMIVAMILGLIVIIIW